MKYLKYLDFVADVLFNILSAVWTIIIPMVYKKIRPTLLRLVRWGLKQGYITLARPTGFIPFIG
jgi:hypothetical protein